VPELALSSSVLFNACLRFASHVKLLRGEVDAALEDRYSERAIRQLIVALEQQQQPSEDQTLAATVILLRTSEQFSEVGEDSQHHFGGASSLFAAQGLQWSPFQIDLRGVAFWIFVRENLHLSILTETPVRFNHDLIHDEDPRSPGSDEVWTNRMSSILARACDACFSYNLPRRQDSIEEVRRSMSLWADFLPESFRPWYFDDSEFAVFPEFRFLKPCHGTFPCVAEIHKFRLDHIHDC
jgi:hypothetical protein